MITRHLVSWRDDFFDYLLSIFIHVFGLLELRVSKNCSPMFEDVFMRWQVSTLYTSCSSCNEDTGNRSSLHNGRVLSCVYATQLPFTLRENRKVPIEQGRHQVLAVCVEDHILQVLECSCELSSETEVRCYEQLDELLQNVIV